LYFLTVITKYTFLKVLTYLWESCIKPGGAYCNHWALKGYAASSAGEQWAKAQWLLRPIIQCRVQVFEGRNALMNVETGSGLSE